MIDLLKHKSIRNVSSFSDDLIPDPRKLLGHYADLMDDILNIPRSGWINRGIEPGIAETVASHCAKVAMATHIIMTNGNHLKNRIDRTVLKAGLHDLCEWKSPDYTPFDISNGKITKEGKYQSEIRSLKEFEKKYKDPIPGMLFIELEEDGDSKDNSLIHQLDKLDAGVMAMNYESYGYDVAEFYPYVRTKLSDPFLKEAFEYLLKKEYPTIDYFYQYCIFLALRGDIGEIRNRLRNR